MSVSFNADPGFDFAVRCLLTGVAYRMAEVGEVLATAADDRCDHIDGWIDAWSERGRRTRAIARTSEAAGHGRSAADAHLRAANYLFVAYWYVAGSSDPGMARPLWQEHRDALADAMRLWPTTVARVGLPYAGTELDGYLMSPRAAGPGPAPLLVIVNGLDTALSDGLMVGGLDAVDRGWAVLFFDGPGQGHGAIVSGLAVRPEFGEVLGPVLDHVLRDPALDPGRVALMGVSHGGYLAARAAACDPRVAALVLDPGVMRVADGVLSQLPAEAVGAFRSGDGAALDAAVAASPDARLAAAKLLESFPGADLLGALTVLAGMDLSGIAHRITVPALVLDPDDAAGWPGQSREVAAALGGEVRRERFTAEDGASLDCEILAPQVRNQRVFDWLEETIPDGGGR